MPTRKPPRRPGTEAPRRGKLPSERAAPKREPASAAPLGPKRGKPKPKPGGDKASRPGFREPARLGPKLRKRTARITPPVTTAAGLKQAARLSTNAGLKPGARRGAAPVVAPVETPVAAYAPPVDLGPQRVQKLLADAGIGSRREIERWMVEGRLTMEGRPVPLGTRALPTARFELDRKPIRIRDRAEVTRRVIAYHKPLGELTTRHDPEGRATVFEQLPRLRGSRWISIGRLDFNTSGLLLFTNDGALANQLMHPKHELEREYAVRVAGKVAPVSLEKLQAGVMLEDGPAKFESFVDVGGEGVNHWYQVVIKEGRNREVRRMFEVVGVSVSRLMRVRYGPIKLDAWLKRGMVRELEPEEIAALVAASASR
jgi:23S rRNA pseudouridine2605 synthase